MKKISQIVLIAGALAGAVFAQGTGDLFFKNCAIVDYDALLPQTATEREKRQRANSRYDNEFWVSGVPPREGISGIGRIDEEVPPASIPVFESNLIALGNIARSAAFLSNDKRGIYTEFTFQISRILKDDLAEKVTKGESVIADRAGGCVRYYTGQVMRYGTSDHGIPFVGKTYLLFLKRERDSPNYKILNGYGIDGQKLGQQLEIYSDLKNYKMMTTAQLIESVLYEIEHPVYRILEVSADPKSPVRITRIKTGFDTIRPGAKFAAEYNWMRRLSVGIENTSGKAVTFAGIRVCFPRPETAKGKPEYCYLLEYGVHPPSEDSYVGYRPKPILPLEKAEVVLDDFAYHYVDSMLYEQSYERGFSRVNVCVGRVAFKDGTIWNSRKNCRIGNLVPGKLFIREN